jgi:hypothetical protein
MTSGKNNQPGTAYPGIENHGAGTQPPRTHADRGRWSPLTVLLATGFALATTRWTFLVIGTLEDASLSSRLSSTFNVALVFSVAFIATAWFLSRETLRPRTRAISVLAIIAIFVCGFLIPAVLGQHTYTAVVAGAESAAP